jgi:desulfoferrodoxin-like iron-binding protein
MDLEKDSVSRREFLNTAAVGAAALAVATAGPVFKVIAKDEKKPAIMPNIFVCSICGHVEFGSAPEFCPICHAPKEKFTQEDNVFGEALANYKDAGISHTPEIMVKKHPSLISEPPTYEIEVRIGKKMHPMEDAHHIRWIDCYVDDKFFARMMLTLGSFPAAAFYTKAAGSNVRAVEVCTVHGHWQAESKIG